MTKETLRKQYEYETGESHGNALFSTTEYACWLEKRIEALSLGAVVGRSEQLPGFWCGERAASKTQCNEQCTSCADDV